ncbi:hypothetical protein ACJJTC_005472 [Scirpophaga incertulas]
MADSDLADLRKQYVEKEAEFDKLRSYVEEYCLLEAQEDVAIQALNKTKDETDESNVDTVEERFTSYLSGMAGKRLNADIHPYMLELKKRIQKGMQLANQDINDSDLAITASPETHIDPITKRPIVDPVKNTVCGHVYEKEAIINLIMRKSSKCPVAGCGNRGPIQKEHLISDEELKFRMTITQHSTMIQDRSVMNLDETIG